MLRTKVTASNWRLPLALVVLMAASWLVLPRALAHAAYESSSPEFAEVLDQSPTQISIRFTQELFRRDGANAITLTNADDGNEIRLAEPRIDNEDRHLMTVAIPDELDPGRYVVSWTNLSAEDGDSDSGSYPFYVGRSPNPSEVEQDRQNAQELLIAYPGDEPAQPEAGEQTPTRAPTVVRSDNADRATLGAGPIIWLAVGIAAALVLAAALGFHIGRRRQAG